MNPKETIIVRKRYPGSSVIQSKAPLSDCTIGDTELESSVFVPSVSSFSLLNSASCCAWAISSSLLILIISV